jgi:predicted DNA-binding protein
MITKGGVRMDKTETQISFRVTNDFKERLEAQARKERRSVAGMVRIVMEDYLAEKENE